MTTTKTDRDDDDHNKVMVAAAKNKVIAAAKTDGDQKVMAAAKQIVKSLGTSNLTEDMMMILSNFDTKLATELSKDIRKSKLQERIHRAENVIHRWDSTCSNPRRRNSLRWEDSPDAVEEYLSAVDDVLRLTEDLRLTREVEILDQADTVIQQAMARLEDEFRCVLLRNTVPLDTSRLNEMEELVSSSRRSMSFDSKISFDSKDSKVSFDLDDGSVISNENGEFDKFAKSVDGGEGGSERGSEHGEAESECSERMSIRLERGRLVRQRSLSGLHVDLINPDAVEKLKEIADRMIKSGYEKECCQAYVGSIREVLDECLSTLGCEKVSMEEVQKIEWNVLSEKIWKWIQALKIVIGVLLPSEKQLCDEVFGGSELMRMTCFTETTKGCVRQLLNFAEAIVIGKRSSEKLFEILNMYEALDEMMRDLQSLFPIEWGENVCCDARGILDGLGEAAKGTLVEFQSAVRNEPSRKVITNGGKHPFTSYVMNYLKLLVEYNKTLNLLLDSNKNNESDSSGGDENTDLSSSSPLGCYLLSLISALELNLNEKSKTYEEAALQHIFLMNNIHYIITKVKESEKLGKLMGDTWVRKRRGQLRQHATSYLRSTWSKVLLFLKDEGLGGSGGASSVSKVLLKERFKSFNLSFEDIYRSQTAWKVSDDQLREELQLSISERVFPAYRSFLGRFHSHLDRGRHADKYIKYTLEDLENYLLDFFVGKPAVLHHPRRKPSA